MNTDRHYEIFIFFTQITGPATIAPVAAPLEYGIQYCMFIMYIPMRSKPNFLFLQSWCQDNGK